MTTLNVPSIHKFLVSFLSNEKKNKIPPENQIKHLTQIKDKIKLFNYENRYKSIFNTPMDIIVDFETEDEFRIRYYDNMKEIKNKIQAQFSFQKTKAEIKITFYFDNDHYFKSKIIASFIEKKQTKKHQYDYFIEKEDFEKFLEFLTPLVQKTEEKKKKMRESYEKNKEKNALKKEKIKELKIKAIQANIKNTLENQDYPYFILETNNNFKIIIKYHEKYKASFKINIKNMTKDLTKLEEHLKHLEAIYKAQLGTMFFQNENRKRFFRNIPYITPQKPKNYQ